MTTDGRGRPDEFRAPAPPLLQELLRERFGDLAELERERTGRTRTDARTRNPAGRQCR